MDSAEEPQKKVFKARKTMRVTDRQQLEAVYKAKGELLKSAEVKLVNGKFENGDSDLKFSLLNTVCMEAKVELNGIPDECLGIEEITAETKETTDGVAVDSSVVEDCKDEDLNQESTSLESENMVSEDMQEDQSAAAAAAIAASVADDKDHLIDRDVAQDDTVTGDESTEGKGEQLSEDALECDLKDSEGEKVAETNNVSLELVLPPSEAEKETEKESIGEETISSSIEPSVEPTVEPSVEPSSDIDENCSEREVIDPPEDSSENITCDQQSESKSENTDSMETEEIIPILEKLAPTEDNLSNFSRASPVLGGNSNADNQEDKMECSPCSTSKQEGNERLPNEAFLVLSDEDEPVKKVETDGEGSSKKVEADGEGSSKKETNCSEISEAVPEEKETLETTVTEEASKDGHKDAGKRPGEILPRKRSKSEDMDTTESKRRRYVENEYEAELQLKITAKGDASQKLEKVIQKLLEEKIIALQCAAFDTALSELKSRVEKIECSKKHEAVLSGLQAKIARLCKRFGAAKEDLKKTQENAAIPPLSPVKNPNTVNAAYRNASTVRQMLETKRSVGDSTASFQTTTSAVTVSSATNVTSVTPSPTVNIQAKPQTSGSSASMVSSVIPSSGTAVVGTSQPASTNAQPLVSLQSLPVILHVPVQMSSQPSLLQTQTGALVANQQSGSVEFIQVQNQPAVSSLAKTSVTFASPSTSKPISTSVALPSPGIQRNSPASSGSSVTTLSSQTISAVASHTIPQGTRTLPLVGNTGLYSPSVGRSSLQVKPPLTGSVSQPSTELSSTATSRAESQITKRPATTTDSPVTKRPAESSAQSGKPAGVAGGSVIDLTLDDEDDGASQDSRKLNQSIGHGTTPSVPSQARPPLPPQSALLQQSIAQVTSSTAGGASQTTMHVLPTAQTTVNVSHRPILQAAPARPPLPRAAASHQMVYTTVTASPVQQSIRGVMAQSQGLRQVSPQTSGVTVRLPQTAPYVVSSGLAVGQSGPQLTVHHRPPQIQEPARPVHPAPLPEAPQPTRLPPEAANTSPPQKPHLKLARVQSQNGIVLSWSVLEIDRNCAAVDSYHLYAYHEDPSATVPSQWKKIGEVKALPLPMACTLTQFVSGSKYYFAVRAKDIYGRFGQFCDPQSTDVISTQSS